LSGEAGAAPAGRRHDPRLAWALAGAGGLAGLAVLHVWTPAEHGGFILCPLRLFAGLPCPGCGMTRAFAHLAKGEWAAAWRDHPLAPFLAAELALGWAAWGAALAGWLRAPRISRPHLIAAGHAAVLVGLWIGRLATGTLPW
jgi:hypothetical protein